MRIGIDGTPLATPKTGIGHYTFELARELARLAPGWEFELVSHVPVAGALERESGGARPPNLRAACPPSTGLRSRWWSLGLPLHARERGLSLFHGTNYKIPLWQQCPSVVTVHDLSLLVHPETHEPRLVELARRRLPTMTRQAARVLTDSESGRREICELLGVAAEKVVAIPLAPRRAFRPVAEAEATGVRRRLGVADDFLLYVGTVEPRKNLLALVRAFDALLRETSLRPQLVIAGRRGWLSDELFALVERTNLRERILFTGYVTDEELRSLYSSCRLCAYPSLYEGFGLPPLEAMACGAAVLTSSIPVIEETCAGAARLVSPHDQQALTRALAELLADTAARARLSEAGRARAARYTWERTARLTLKVYEEVLREWREARRAAGA
jgi:glycosyltransferase involved in cell wall biosynthesis